MISHGQMSAHRAIPGLLPRDGVLRNMQRSVLKHPRTGKTGWTRGPTPVSRPRMRAMRRSKTEIHFVLDRMRRHSEARDLFHLEPDVCVDHVVGEYPPLGEKLPVAIEVIEGFVERSARMRDLRGLLGLEIVEVL